MRVVYRGRAFAVGVIEVAAPRGGGRMRREIVRHGPSVVILARDAAGRVLLERQLRYAVGERLWELPAGGVEPGEAPLAAGKRELLEETGFRARRWRRLGRFYSSPGFVDEEMHLYLAEGLAPGPRRLEADEEIASRWFTPAEMRGLIAAGKIHDAKTLAAWTLREAFARRARRRRA